MKKANNVNLQSSFSNGRSRRPFSVTILVIMVLIFTSLNALRAITAFRLRDFLTGLPLDVPVVYLTLTGVIWTALGVPLVVSLFLGYSWSRPLLRWAAGLYTTYYWIEHLWVIEPGALVTRWPFALGLNLALIGFAFWVFSRPKPRDFLSK